MHDVVVERRTPDPVGSHRQRPADQDLVEHLAVALEDVGVPLVLRQRAGQVDQSFGAGPDHDVDRLAELEVVDVAEDHNLGMAVGREELVDESPDLLGLEVTSGL